MRKRSMLIRADNWQLSFLYQLRRFQKRGFPYTFQTLFAQKQRLVYPYLKMDPLHKNGSFQHYISYDLRQIATYIILGIRFFQRLCFLGVLCFLRSKEWVRFLDDSIIKELSLFYYWNCVCVFACVWACRRYFCTCGWIFLKFFENI